MRPRRCPSRWDTPSPTGALRRMRTAVSAARSATAATRAARTRQRRTRTSVRRPIPRASSIRPVCRRRAAPVTTKSSRRSREPSTPASSARRPPAPLASRVTKPWRRACRPRGSVRPGGLPDGLGVVDGTLACAARPRATARGRRRSADGPRPRNGTAGRARRLAEPRRGLASSQPRALANRNYGSETTSHG